MVLMNLPIRTLLIYNFGNISSFMVAEVFHRILQTIPVLVFSFNFGTIVDTTHRYFDQLGAHCTKEISRNNFNHMIVELVINFKGSII